MKENVVAAINLSEGTINVTEPQIGTVKSKPDTEVLTSAQANNQSSKHH